MDLLDLNKEYLNSFMYNNSQRQIKQSLKLKK